MSHILHLTYCEHIHNNYIDHLYSLVQPILLSICTLVLLGGGGGLKIVELAPLIMHLHEQGMSIVNGIAELKGEYSVCSTTFELCPQLGGSQSIVIESIVPANPLQSLNVTTN